MNPNKHLFALALPLMAATIAAQAQTPTPAPTATSECVDIEDGVQRLDCYDQLHARKAALPPTALQVTPPAQPASAPTVVADVLPTHSLLDARWDLDGVKAGLYKPRTYRPMYILPLTWTDHTNHQPTSAAPGHTVSNDLGVKAMEAKFQISLKSKLAEDLLGTEASLWGGYTQSSRWQVYSPGISRPFRETNYEPEVMLVLPLHTDVLGWSMRLGSLSLNHQSNGRDLPLSRSWNRVIGSVVLERDDWVAEVRPWKRLHESATNDDNPHIEDYVGRLELGLTRHWGDHSFAVQLRHSLRGGDRSHGSGQLEWAFPINGALHGFVQLFNGYGESLIDYNLRQNKLGLGISLADWH